MANAGDKWQDEDDATASKKAKSSNKYHKPKKPKATQVSENPRKDLK